MCWSMRLPFPVTQEASQHWQAIITCSVDNVALEHKKPEESRQHEYRNTREVNAESAQR